MGSDPTNPTHVGPHVDRRSGNEIIDVSGGGGRTILGEEGNDYLYGLDGNDYLHGNEGADVVFGGDGNDEIHGGKENDFLAGESGDDTIVGGNQSDTLHGGPGNDRLYGDRPVILGDDPLDPRVDGDDTLQGQAGANSLEGAGGNDTFVIVPDPGTTDTVEDFSRTTGNNDCIDLSAFPTIRRFSDLMAVAHQVGADVRFDLPNKTLIVKNFTVGAFTPEMFKGGASVVNSAPTNINLSNALIAENLAAGSLVGVLSSVDANSDETFSYALVSGTGDADNGSFSIVGDELRTNAVFDFETKNSYSIRLRSTDSSGLSIERVFGVQVVNVNETPTATNDGLSDIVQGSGVRVIPFASLLANDTTGPLGTHEVGQTLAITAVASTQGGVALINGTNVEFTPTPGYTGPASFSYTIQDDGVTGGVSDPKTSIGLVSFSIIAASNVPPVVDLNGADQAGTGYTASFVATSVSIVDTDLTIADFDSPTLASAVLTLSGRTSFFDEFIAVNTSGTSITVSYNTTTGVLFLSGVDTTANYQQVLRTTTYFNSTGTPLTNNRTVAFQVNDGSDASNVATSVIVGDTSGSTPSDIGLSNATLAENQPANSLIGTLSTIDPDAADTFSYSLASGTGDTDNGSFTLVGHELRAAQSFNFEAKSAYSLRIRSTDQTGRFVEKAFSISILDVNETPTGVADSLADVLQGSGVVQIPFSAVLANDTTGPSSTQEAGQTLTVVAVAAPNGGTVTIVGSMIEFTPANGFTGLASFTYTLRDDGFTNGVSDPKSSTAVVSFHVTPDLSTGPVLDLNGSGSPGTGNTVIFIGSGVEILLAENATLIDPDLNAPLSGRSLTIQLSGNLDTFQEQLLANVSGTSLSASYHPVSGLLSIIGAEPISEYQRVLRTITYRNIAGAPSQGTRSAVFRYNNGTVTSNSAVATIIYPGSDAPPTDLLLSHNQAAENVLPGATVGTFSTIDATSGDSFTYSLVPGMGSEGNGQLLIVGNQLVANSVFNFEAQDSYSVRVRTTDQTGLFLERTFIISVTNVNESPTITSNGGEAVANIEVDEDDTFVTDVDAVDPDAGTNISYSLAGGADQAAFQINGTSGHLSLIAAGSNGLPDDADHDGIYEVVVRASDGSLYDEQLVRVSFFGTQSYVSYYGDVDLLNTGVYGVDPTVDTTLFGLRTGESSVSSFISPPHTFPFAPELDEFPGTDQIYVAPNQSAFGDGYSSYPGRLSGPQVLSLDYSSMAPVGTVITTFTLGLALDDFQRSMFGGTYTVTVNGVAHSVLAGLMNAEDLTGPKVHFVTVGVSPALLNSSHILTVEISNTGSGNDGWAIDFATIGVTTREIGEAPTNILLDGNTVAENRPAGTSVGSLSAVDSDLGDVAEFSLVTGVGSEGNASFTIVGDELRTATVLNFEQQSSYSVRIRATDEHGLSFEKVFLIQVTDVNESPTGVNDVLADLPEDSPPLSIPFATLLANDTTGPNGTNEADQTLSMSNIDSPVGGTIHFSGLNVVFTPTPNYNGPAGFRYIVRDNGSTGGAPDYRTTTAVASFTITAVNDPPSNVISGSPGPAKPTLLGRIMLFPLALVGFNDKLIFMPGSEPGLMITDVNTTQTTKISDSEPAWFGVGVPREYGEANGLLYFAGHANDSNGASFGVELWKSDGTSSGTVLVRDINTTTSHLLHQRSSYPHSFVNANGTLFFAANRGELWKSDGTSSGTTMVRDASPSVSYARYLTNVNGRVFFRGRGEPDLNGSQDEELWVSDGTSSGTRVVKDIRPGFLDSRVKELCEVNGVLFFNANDGVNGPRLWKTDGTYESTVMINTVSGPNALDPTNLTNVNGRLYFKAYNPTSSYGLWSYDEASDRIVSVWEDSLTPALDDFVNANGQLYFVAGSHAGNLELWKSDGTSSGTEIVRDIRAESGPQPRNITVVGRSIYFTAFDDATGYELWRSDGTSSGTVLVQDTYVGTHSSSPRYLTNVNGTLFFVADNSEGSDIWTISESALSANEDAPLNITGIAISDIDAGTASISVTLSVDHGTLTLSTQASGGVTAGHISDNGTSTVVITAPLAAINATLVANSGLVYLGNLDYHGSDSLLIVTNDLGNTGSGGALVDSDRIAIEVLPVDDFVPPTVSLRLEGSPVAENGGTATLVATLSNAYDQDVSITLSAQGTASLADYSLSAMSMVILAGNTSGSILITAIDDLVFEGNESLVFDVTGVTNGTENGVQQVTATITDDDAQPSVSLSVIGSTLAENSGVATVRATLSNPSTQNVTVNLAFTGSATLGSDYTRSAAAITILAGNTSGSLILTGLNDPTVEGNESIIVDVTSVTNGTENGVQQVTATIVDDDTANVNLTLAPTSLAENGGTATVTATLSNPSTQNVTVNLAFTGSATLGSDYTRSAAAITILAGNTSGTLILTGLNDATVEGNESIIVDVTSVTNGTENGVQQVTATIVDDDPQFVAPTLDLNGPLSGTSYSATILQAGATVPIVSATSLSLTDPDSSTMVSATLVLSQASNGASETLAVNTTGTAITAVYNSANRTLSLSGVALIQQYQQVLRTATYQNLSLSPSTTSRTVTFTVSDGITNSNTANATVQFSIVASAPIVDLDGAASANFSYAASFNRLSGAVNAVGPIATIVDTSSLHLASGMATLSPRPNSSAEVLAANTAGTAITATYNPSTGVLSLSGIDTVQNYQNVLRTITYNNTAVSPTTGQRFIQFVVNDGGLNSSTRTSTITVQAINAAPIVTTSSTALDYVRNTPAVIVDSTLIITDVDAQASPYPQIQAAEVIISGGFMPGQDQLVYTNTAGIPGTFNSTTGILTLTGFTSINNYHTALRSVKFQTTSTALGARTISFRVRDASSAINGSQWSNPATRTINVLGPLLASNAATPSPLSTSPSLTFAQLRPIVTEAIARWSNTGISSSQLAILTSATVEIRDLNRYRALGLAGGNRIIIDDDAVGFGWFVDSTPRDDKEFTKVISKSERIAPGMTRMDLLTVVMHEMGHILGLPDIEDDRSTDVMTDTIAPGTRRVSTAADLQALAWYFSQNSTASTAPLRNTDAVRADVFARWS